MKKLLFTTSLLVLVFTACSTDNINSTEEEITVNLETFIPDSKFDESSRGKYVGVFGHHTNFNIHGKIFFNVGQHNQYDALVRLVDGTALKFSVDHSLDVDVSNLYFKGETGSFLADFSDYENPIITNVAIKGEETPGYIIAKKATRGAIPLIMLGSYVDALDGGFAGNWDAITDGIAIPLSTPLGPTTGQNIYVLTISHTGAPAPFTDLLFEPNPPLPCLDIVTGSVPTPMIVNIPIFGGFAIVGGLQTTNINGVDVNWTLAHAQDNPFFPGGVYYDVTCTQTTAGNWSWNTRSGSITVLAGI